MPSKGTATIDLAIPSVPASDGIPVNISICDDVVPSQLPLLISKRTLANLAVDLEFASNAMTIVWELLFN